MDRFLKHYPAVAMTIFTGLVSVIAFLAVQNMNLNREAVVNNTQALDRLTCTIDQINRDVVRLDTVTKTHEKRLDRLEGP